MSVQLPEGEQMNDENQRCTAAANLRGEHIQCDEPAGHSWAHGNSEHGLIWDGPGMVFMGRRRAKGDPDA